MNISRQGITRQHITAEHIIGTEDFSTPNCNLEDYVVDEEEKETENKQRKTNKQKLAKNLKDRDYQYLSPETKKIVPVRSIKERYNSVISKSTLKSVTILVKMIEGRFLCSIMD